MMPFFRKRKINPDEMKNEIIRLIDESREVIYKIAFYSQPEVQEILERVSKRWEESGYQGRPIDYASAEELEMLYKIARRIVSRSPEELWSTYGREYLPTA